MDNASGLPDPISVWNELMETRSASEITPELLKKFRTCKDPDDKGDASRRKKGILMHLLKLYHVLLLNLILNWFFNSTGPPARAERSFQSVRASGAAEHSRVHFEEQAVHGCRQ